MFAASVALQPHAYVFIIQMWTGAMNVDPVNQLHFDCSLPLPNNNIASKIYSIVGVHYTDNNADDDVVCNMKIVDGTTVTFTGAQQRSRGVFAQGNRMLWEPPRSSGVAYVSCRIPAHRSANPSGLHQIDVFYENL